MKLEIKVKNLKDVILPEVIDKGEWIDLRTAEEVSLNAPTANILHRNKERSYRDVIFNTTTIPLGIAMKLPKGFEAILAPRSSTFSRYRIIQANNFGVIDNSYSGNNDEWLFPVIAFDETTILRGTRICQFRIQLSQKATFWQKIKWLLSSGIKIVEVDNLDTEDRGGFGSTN
jgi:dUTP pyrophosphatase